MIQITIPGEVKGKGRPKFSRQGVYVRTYTPEATANYENLVKVIYLQKYKDFSFGDKPLIMTINAYFNIPKSTSKKKRELMLSDEIRPTRKPDADNISKIIADSLNSIAYKDDSQIVSLSCNKFYADEPRVDILISEVE